MPRFCALQAGRQAGSLVALPEDSPIVGRLRFLSLPPPPLTNYRICLAAKSSFFRKEKTTYQSWSSAVFVECCICISVGCRMQCRGKRSRWIAASMECGKTGSWEFRAAGEGRILGSWFVRSKGLCQCLARFSPSRRVGSVRQSVSE